MVRCKSATPEWQRHKGTQEQPPGLGWAGLGWAGLGWAVVSAISAGMALYWVTLYWVTPPPLSPPADMQAVFVEGDSDVVQHSESQKFKQCCIILKKNYQTWTYGHLVKTTFF